MKNLYTILIAALFCSLAYGENGSPLSQLICKENGVMAVSITFLDNGFTRIDSAANEKTAGGSIFIRNDEATVTLETDDFICRRNEFQAMSFLPVYVTTFCSEKETTRADGAFKMVSFMIDQENSERRMIVNCDQ